MNVICTICARKNSVGVKNKAIQILGGKPLIAHTIIQAKKSKIFNRIVVSTDSKRIQKIALNYGADSWFLRPQKLAKKLSSKESAILIKEKIRNEIKSGLLKENILNKEDAILLKQFYKKIKKELESSN